jgi:hypothetical protein
MVQARNTSKQDELVFAAAAALHPVSASAAPYWRAMAECIRRNDHAGAGIEAACTRERSRSAFDPNQVFRFATPL